ncbi:MAG: hypothetical protein ACO3UU_06655 [Minisyncoccia bacterium]
MASSTSLDRKKLHIKMRLNTGHLTEKQRLDLERELCNIEEQLEVLPENVLSNSLIELRGQSLRM